MQILNDELSFINNSNDFFSLKYIPRPFEKLLYTKMIFVFLKTLFKDMVFFGRVLLEYIPFATTLPFRKHLT